MAVVAVSGGGDSSAARGPGEPTSDDADDQVGLSSKRGGELDEGRWSFIPGFCKRVCGAG